MPKETGPALPGGIETGCHNVVSASTNSCLEPPEQFDPTAALLQALERIEELEDDVLKLRDKVAIQDEAAGILRQFVEAKLGSIPGKDLFSDSLKNYEIQRESRDQDHFSLMGLKDQVDEEIMPAINRLQKSSPSSSSGTVNEQRVKEIERLLKASRDGSMSFKVIRAKMKLEPNQFSRVISSLDKRRFEVISNNQAPKEKILRIKARWS